MTDQGRWPEGAEEIEGMLSAGSLERVTPSPTHALRLLAEAERHLGTARMVADADPPMAYDSLYSAARKALVAALAQQGLRATSRGGHLVVQFALEAQLGRVRHVVKAFNRLRVTRNEADYPREESPPLSSADVHEDLPAAADIVDAMRKFVPRLGPF
jgi:hypothetical protein